MEKETVEGIIVPRRTSRSRAKAIPVDKGKKEEETIKKLPEEPKTEKESPAPDITIQQENLSEKEKPDTVTKKQKRKTKSSSTSKQTIEKKLKRMMDKHFLAKIPEVPEEEDEQSVDSLAEEGDSNESSEDNSSQSSDSNTSEIDFSKMSKKELVKQIQKVKKEIIAQQKKEKSVKNKTKSTTRFRGYKRSKKENEYPHLMPSETSTPSVLAPYRENYISHSQMSSHGSFNPHSSAPRFRFL